MCIQKKVFSCIGMWVYREKYFLIYSDGCIVFANMHKKIETKRKEKERPRRSACYGHRKHKSSNSSHGEDEGCEEDEGGWRNEMYRERRNHRRYGGRQREEGIKGIKVKIPTFKGICDP